jgi:hypothetical protein
VLQESWALFRRDADLLLRLAGPFLFLPSFALVLLVPSPPEPPAGGTGEAAALAWADAVSAWLAAHGGWYLLAYAATYLGHAAILGLYLDRASGDVGGALRRAGSLAPRYLLASLFVALPAGAGLLLWLLPGFYVIGRTLPLGPVLVAERPIGAAAAIARTLAMTRGRGLQLAALAALIVSAGYIAGQPFLLLDASLREGGAGPVALSLAAAGAAMVATGAGLAQLLLAMAVYRRLRQGI